MDYSEFLKSLRDPLYEVKGKIPQCPPGYRWDTKSMRCLPKTDKDKVSDQNPPDASPQNMAAFNVWGATGLNGDGYAIEEETMYQETESEKRKREEKEANHKKDDDRMRYGKSGKPPEDELIPGEVRKFNKETGKWESNKR